MLLDGEPRCEERLRSYINNKLQEYRIETTENYFIAAYVKQHKKFKELRWEEIWDCATRIRNIFLKKQIPEPLNSYLSEKITSRFSGKTLAVRSSAPDEDASGSSFAGLHESFVNVRGTASILDHIRRVWASLWSDAALLYRQEIGLDIETSAMAVVLQETVIGNRSGVVFTQNPNDETQMIIDKVLAGEDYAGGFQTDSAFNRSNASRRHCSAPGTLLNGGQILGLV